MDIVLAIDTNIDIYEEVAAECMKYGVHTQRIDSIQKAVATVLAGDEYLFIWLNEDSDLHFMEQLPLLRDITNAPIFVSTSSYAVWKHTKAVELGADAYMPFGDSTTENVRAWLVFLKLNYRLAKRPYKLFSVLIGGSIILSPVRRSVFVDGVQVSLTKKEFEILEYLMRRQNHPVTHVQLLQAVWGEEYGERDVPLIWKTVDHLRAKLLKASPSGSVITAERGVGYMFSPHPPGARKRDSAPLRPHLRETNFRSRLEAGLEAD